MKKFFKHTKALIICFLVVPILVSFLIVIKFNTFLENPFVQNLILISGYFFTFSSLLLVFALLNTFNPSDHQRSAANKKFLEDGLEKLVKSLTAIRNNVKKNDTKELYENCAVVTDIHDYLKTPDLEVDLKAYATEIKDIVNLINRHKLPTIGLESDDIRLKAMRVSNRRNIIFKIDYLLRQLKQRSYSNED